MKPVAERLAAALLLLTACACNGDEKPHRSFVIRVNANIQQFGGWDINRSPTFEAAIAAFGEPSRCRLRYGTTSWSEAEWRPLGVRAVFTSLAGFPKGKDACSEKDKVVVDLLFVTGRRWRSSTGLRIGHSTTRLRALYASATHHAVFSGPFEKIRGSYWSIAETRYSALMARMRNGKVGSFVARPAAEGD
ncbi:MAG TPA: hypothetical protein VGQ68_07070 [Gaiellaceae bacterium]|jgi:hypothetical protein|nr:hypothetical protein [Gaiellaceae bacterium]